MQPSLRIPIHDLRAYAARYNYKPGQSFTHLKEAAKRQGYLTRSQLHEIAEWKSPRRVALINKNEEDLVREATQFAFRTKYEGLRISVLSQLMGVHFPTASAVLHFCVDYSYPILDFRALWSLGLKRPSTCTVDYWVKYIAMCRSLASQHELTVRELDMALWQYSRDHQRSSSPLDE